MRRLVLAGATFASLVLLAGCGERGSAGSEEPTPQPRTAETQAPAETAMLEPFPTDSSIICPGSKSCPTIELPLAPPSTEKRKFKPIGVLIPEGDIGDDILCPQHANRPDKPCPPGYHGRLWKAPEAPNEQSVCPGGNGCPASADWYGWVCPWDGVNAPAQCKGRSKQRPRNAPNDD